jgi:hypothetical protein
MNGKLIPAALVAVGMLLVGSVAWGASPDADGVVRACVANAGLPIADTDAGSCKRKKPSGLAEYQIVSSDPVTLAPGASGEAQVACPGGTRALGGGYITGPSVHITSVIPADAGTVWSASGRNESDMIPDSIRARAICADVTP